MRLYHRLKRQVLSRTGLVRVLLGVVILVLAVVIWKVAVSPATRHASNFLGNYNQTLPTQNGRTTFLLLGVAGGDHAGADLTDTIIFVSVDQEGKVTMLSIPRDIWVKSLRAKINTAYHYGEQRQPGTGGFILARAAASEIIGQPVQYTALINFANFEKVIDSLGGVDIMVDRAFDDFEFPIAGREEDLCDGDPEYKCRYEHLHFDAGLKHMDGATALKYVRSRHAEGEEGTDFARSARQEKLLLAIKTKLLSGDLLSRPQQISELYKSLSQSIVTDVDSSMYPALVKLALKINKTNNIDAVSLSQPDQLDNPPITPEYNNEWVLIPKNNDPKVIFDFVAGQLNK